MQRKGEVKLNEIIVIRTGYKYRGENWNSFINGYFKDVMSAERYLENEGYEFAYDDVYTKVNDEEITVLAKIEGLDLIDKNY